MPLSTPVSRLPLHHRAISTRGYRRDDGLFEVEAHLHDTKDIPFKLVSGEKPAGASVHSMWLRMTYDVSLTIVDAEAAMDAMPYQDYCEKITPKYKQLIGMTMRPGFGERVRKTFAGTKGCTHLTDLIGIAATTAFQSLAGQVTQDQASKPFQLDRCHALATNGAAVIRYYPAWVRGDISLTDMHHDAKTK
ncbi:MAG: DUF2889 domain-containing protein [Pseudomonadota bacterium]